MSERPDYRTLDQVRTDLLSTAQYHMAVGEYQTGLWELEKVVESHTTPDRLERLAADQAKAHFLQGRLVWNQDLAAISFDGAMAIGDELIERQDRFQREDQPIDMVAINRVCGTVMAAAIERKLQGDEASLWAGLETITKAALVAYAERHPVTPPIRKAWQTLSHIISGKEPGKPVPIMEQLETLEQTETYPWLRSEEREALRHGLLGGVGSAEAA